MFEMEGYEWTKKNISLGISMYNPSIEMYCGKAFKDGAEFGYNKAKVEVEESYKESLCNSELNLASVTEQLEELEKANEWHYVEDGDLPEKSDSTLRQLLPVTVAVKIAGVSSAITTYGTWWDIRCGKFVCLDEVYAWCYTPEPPELPKESE